MKPIPSAHHLAECFTYIEGALYWRQRPREHFRTARACNMWNAKFAGKRAGRPMPCQPYPYRQIGLDGHRYLEHRIIAAMHGMPTTACIDHIDGDVSNNHIANLRSATATQNARNNPGWKKKALRVGVSRLSNGKFVAYIRRDGRHVTLGRFSAEEDAVQARIAAEKAAFGGFSYQESRIERGVVVYRDEVAA